MNKIGQAQKHLINSFWDTSTSWGTHSLEEIAGSGVWKAPRMKLLLETESHWPSPRTSPGLEAPWCSKTQCDLGKQRRSPHTALHKDSLTQTLTLPSS